MKENLAWVPPVEETSGRLHYYKVRRFPKKSGTSRPSRVYSKTRTQSGVLDGSGVRPTVCPTLRGVPSTSSRARSPNNTPTTVSLVRVSQSDVTKFLARVDTGTYPGYDNSLLGRVTEV